MEKIKNGITEGVIWKQLLLFFFPILIGTFFQQLYNTVDTIIVGQFVGTEALAAVGTTGTVINLLVGFFVGVASGATVIISQYFGANDRESLSKSVHTSMALAVAGGVVIMVIGIVTARPTMLAMGVPDDIMDDAVLYMNVYYLGIIGNLIYNIGTGILRAIGDSRMPLYVLIVCCLANVVLDLLFVVVFHWGVFGVAFATVLSQLISAVLFDDPPDGHAGSIPCGAAQNSLSQGYSKECGPHRLAGRLAVCDVFILEYPHSGEYQQLWHDGYRGLGGYRQD